ncbi:ATP-binding protein [Streptomonospora arabica]|uniref:ATP-binding protein n=1 Tax=Streptomonospora arabica TaxID=412417 RepID=A0ABV9SLN4_9ACTN
MRTRIGALRPPYTDDRPPQYRLPGTPEAAREAREYVTSALGPNNPLLSEAQLIASELVTNAYLHSRSGLPDGTIGFTVAPLVCGCFIEVADAGPRSSAPTSPRVRVPDGDEAEGRGLLLIDATAYAWGDTACPCGGRSVWALLVHAGEQAQADAA